MNKTYFSIENDDFYGAYYPCCEPSKKAMLLVLGEIGSKMTNSAVKWLQSLNCNVMVVVHDKSEQGWHSFPIERFEKAIVYLKTQGNRKIGIIGASATSTVALAAAAICHDITLSIMLTPADYVMEGYYRDGLDGVGERPGNFESIVSYKGEDLPFVPYAYRHPQYWYELKKESKESGNIAAARKLFDESERLHPIREEEKIKIENIKGRLILVGAEDDTLWDTCRYIRRMTERLKNTSSECKCEAFIYEHGTHFVFPQSMIKMMFPLVSGLIARIAFKAARQFPNECKRTRIDIEEKLSRAIREW